MASRPKHTLQQQQQQQHFFSISFDFFFAQWLSAVRYSKLTMLAKWLICQMVGMFTNTHTDKDAQKRWNSVEVVWELESN